MSTALTLYEVESSLQAFEDTEALVTPEDREQFEIELANALRMAKDKRESFGRFILSYEAAAESAQDEAKRLMERAARLNNAAKRAREFGTRVITGLGKDDKGKYPKLDASSLSLSVRKNPDTVDIVDEDQIPEQFKKTTVVVAVDKRAIKAAIDAGEVVPGADMKFGDYRLEVK
jgi:hypothetical protein